MSQIPLADLYSMSLDRQARPRGAESSPSSTAVAPGRTTLTSRLVQRKAERAPGEAAEGALDRAAGSSGAQLPEDMRERFESSLGADLSGVRIHTGAESADAASAVGARAYAIGNDIHFRDGAYDPSSRDGQLLIAHEVAHTVQQQGGSRGAQYKLDVSQPGDAAEVEADAAASAMVDGGAFQVGGAGVSIARDPEKKDAGGGDDKKEKPKYPSWKDGVSSFPLPKTLGGGTLKIDCNDPPGGSMDWSGKAEGKVIDLKHTWNTPLPVPGTMVDFNAAIDGGLTASASASIGGKWIDRPGPTIDVEKMLEISASGGGKVEAKLGGSIGLGAAVGVPMANIAGGGRLGVEATAGIGATVTGTGQRFPEGNWMGQVMLDVTGEAKIKATGSLYVELVLGEDRTNLWGLTLGEREIGVAKITCKCGVDLATGAAIEMQPVVVAEWKGLFDGNAAKPVRKLSESERAKLLPVNQGASGAPGALPDPDVPCEPGGGGQGGAASDCPKEPAQNDGGGGGDGGAGGAGGGGGGGGGGGSGGAGGAPSGGNGAHGAPGS